VCFKAETLELLEWLQEQFSPRSGGGGRQRWTRFWPPLT